MYNKDFSKYARLLALGIQNIWHTLGVYEKWGQTIRPNVLKNVPNVLETISNSDQKNL